MSKTDSSLVRSRAKWMRLDTVQILKRFFFCERSLIISQAAWIPLIASFGTKTALPRFVWQNAQTANSLRNRIFELKYPSRILEEEGADRPLVLLFRSLQSAPSLAALLLGLSDVLLPALCLAYRDYLRASDPIADGPAHRFLGLAVQEKEDQVRTMGAWAKEILAAHPEDRSAATAWVRELQNQLSACGGVGIGPAVNRPQISTIPGSRAYKVPDIPARDSQFWLCRFYWPDIVDPSYPYGEGPELQLRTAISHLNEVWAIETAGIILSSFADLLPWEWINDSARWMYDEARHTIMGYQRLLTWDFHPAQLPLGTYIYESAAGQDPVYRLGMLFFFETKNIRFKSARAKLFHAYGDQMSEHDMDFDWADETMHAAFGKRWLKQLLSVRGEDPGQYEAIREHCGELVRACVASAAPSEVEAIKRVASVLIEQIHQMAGSL